MTTAVYGWHQLNSELPFEKEITKLGGGEEVMGGSEGSWGRSRDENDQNTMRFSKN